MNGKSPTFTLGKLMRALPRVAPMPAASVSAVPRPGKSPGTVKLNRLPLSKIKTGAGY